ncbi:MAG TPA: hypothetical protein VJS69_07340 [Candidatus Krumholzibacteria bacterium]|nr:hypothetical protein [Candidatus Krumholzibacteria bacterium]
MSPLKKVVIIVLFLMLVPVSILLAYAYNSSQHEDHGWNIVLTSITYPEKHPRVTIDRAHHNAHTARGKYRPFAEMLRMDGCEVKNGLRNFSAGSLKKTDVLVIVNAAGAGHPQLMGINLPLPQHGQRDDPAFSAKEIAAVRTWVQDGGSLLLIADHAPFGSASAALAGAFGVHMHQGFTEIPNEKSDPMEFSVVNKRLPQNAITAGQDSTTRVNRVFTFTGQSLDGPANATVLLALPSNAIEYVPPKGDQEGRVEMKEEKAGNAQGLAFDYGKGRVVVLGEAAMLTAQVYKGDHFGMNSFGCDNQQFALNIVHWLTHTI